MQIKTPNGHGGPRKGAGRPPEYQCRTTRNVALEAELLTWAELEAQRRGTNLSRLVQIALEQMRAQP